MAKYVVLLGPPGAGKGTQAKIISKELNLAHISSGDLFRENLKEKTELGQQAVVYMNRGELVPDDITIGMVRERIKKDDCAKGAILDGFPRTPAQAESLAEMLKGLGASVFSVPYISVPPEVLIERLSGRWTCRVCGHVYHQKYNPPAVVGRCDEDGAELFQREDDQSDTVKNRIRVYMDQTAPLIDYYRNLGLLVEIDGNQPIEIITRQLLEALDI